MLQITFAVRLLQSVCLLLTEITDVLSKNGVTDFVATVFSEVQLMEDKGPSQLGLVSYTLGMTAFLRQGSNLLSDTPRVTQGSGIGSGFLLAWASTKQQPSEGRAKVREFLY